MNDELQDELLSIGFNIVEEIDSLEEVELEIPSWEPIKPKTIFDIVVPREPGISRVEEVLTRRKLFHILRNGNQQEREEVKQIFKEKYNLKVYTRKEKETLERRARRAARGK